MSWTWFGNKQMQTQMNIAGRAYCDIAEVEMETLSTSLW